MIYTAHRFPDAAALAAALALAEPLALDDIGAAYTAAVLDDQGEVVAPGELIPGHHANAAWREAVPEAWAASVIPATDAARWWSGVPRVPLAPEPVTSAQVDAERDRRIDAGMTFNSTRFQTRPQDRENVAGASIMALAAMVGGAQPGDLRWHGGASDFVWIGEANTLTAMDAQTFFAFGQAMAAHKSALIFAARALKDSTPIPADFASDAYWP
jgi:hypothetical protein